MHSHNWSVLLFTDAWSWLWFMTWLSVLWEILLLQTMLAKQRSTEGKRYDGFKLNFTFEIFSLCKYWKSFSLGGNGAYHRPVRWWLAERDLQLMGGQLMIKTKQLDQVLLFFFLVWNDIINWTASLTGVWESVQSRSQTGKGVRPAGDDNTSSWIWRVRGETWKTPGVLHLHWRFELDF